MAFWKKKTDKQKTQTFTKRWVSRLLWFSCFWITASYYLAFKGKEVIAEELSSTVATIIVGTILGYFLKSYFETKEEKKCEYQNLISSEDEEMEE